VAYLNIFVGAAACCLVAAIMVRNIQPNLSATTGTAACMTNLPINPEHEDTQVIRQKNIEKSQKSLE
jgi:hypothetical protein